jgi:hypothetical protein
MNAKLSIGSAAALWAAISAVSPVLAARGFGDDCLRSDCDAFTFSQAVTIPDGVRAGVLIGPLAVEGEGSLEGLVVRIEIRHPATGDVDLRLCYDEDKDGIPDATAPLEFYLARKNACTAAEPFASPAELSGDYYFHDGGPGVSEPIFSAFRGLERGGRFYLAAVDSMAQESGSISNWSVYLNRPGTESVNIGGAAFPVGFVGLPR